MDNDFDPFVTVWADRVALAAGDWSYVVGWRRLFWRVWVRE